MRPFVGILQREVFPVYDREVGQGMKENPAAAKKGGETEQSRVKYRYCWNGRPI
jgi:hypothetical protein